MLFRVILLFCFVLTITSDPLSFAETENNAISRDQFTFDELTTRADRFPVRAGERSCTTCRVASNLLEPFCQSEGIFSDIINCRKYYVCDTISDKPVELKCPESQLFSKASATCESKDSVVCEDRLDAGSLANEVISFRSQTPRIALRNTTPKFMGLIGRTNRINFLGPRNDANAPFNCPRDGLFTDPLDCSAFYSCFRSFQSRIQCPSTLLFNPDISVCDYAENVVCRTATTTPTPTVIPTTQRPITTAPTTTIRPTTSGPTINPTTSPDPSLKRVCYFTNWARYRPEPGKFDPEDIDRYFCTHLIYAFAVLDQNTFLIKSHDPWADIDLKGYEKVTSLRKYGLKVLLAIGGWTDSAGSKYSLLVANSIRRANFIKDVIEFLKLHNFDGLDLDWEFPRCWQSSCVGPAEDKPNFVQFVKELRIAFNQQNPPLLLTAAVSANPNIARQAYDIPELSKNLDFFNLMSYDYHGSWEKKTGHVTPLFASPHDENKEFNVDASVTHYLNNGAPPSKIVLGFPTYGRSFTLQNANNNGYNAPATAGAAGPVVREAGTLSYLEICTKLRNEQWVKVRGTNEVGPYAFSGNQWVSYMDVEAIANFGQYILNRNLGGAMVWAIDFDDFNAKCCSIKSPVLSTIERLFTGYGPAIRDIVSNCSLPGISPTDVEIRKPTTERPVSRIPVPTTERPVSRIPVPMKRPDGNNNQLDCPNKDVEFLADPTSCNYFYVCANGSPVRMQCPGNLQFNPRNNVCDWPELSGCRINI